MLTLTLIASALAATTTTVTEGYQQVGTFDGKVLPEVSGMSFSPTSDRVYVVNDSGDSSRFFVTSPTGAVTGEVAVTGPFPTDVEDLAVGPCQVGSCLFVGDVGDNGVSRSSVRIVLVQELNTFPGQVSPVKSLTVKYSDGKPHNCESLGVHPVSGDLFLVTKVTNDPHVYKIPGAEITSAGDGATLVAKDIGTIDIGSLFPGGEEVVTGMAISPDGKRFSLITYNDAYEFAFDVSAWQTVWTSQLLEVDRVRYDLIPRLQQQEAISYDKKTGGLFYTTEVNSTSPAPLVKIPNVVPSPPPPPPTGPPVVVTPPSVSGQYMSGKTLSALPGKWTGLEPITFKYQWKRCTAAGTGCVAITGAKSDTFPLTDVDVGKTVRVKVVATNTIGSTTANTSPVIVKEAEPQPQRFPLGTICNATGTAYSRPTVLKNVIVVIFENRDSSSVTNNPQAPYFNSIKSQCGTSTQYRDNTFSSDINSLSHYLALTAGSNCNTGLGTNGSGCVTDDSGPGSHRLSTRSIFNQVPNWKAYQEDMPKSCDWGNPASGTKYWVKHNPPPYFTQVTDCGARDVGISRIDCPATLNGTCTSPDNVFTQDLANDTLPAYSFVTPDIINDMHDSGVSVGDNWLHTYLPLIFKSPAYLRGDVAIYILWDEEEGSFGGSPIPNIFISPYIQPTVSNVVINHFSALRSMESQLGLTEFLGCASGTPPGGVGTCPEGSTADLRTLFNF